LPNSSAYLGPYTGFTLRGEGILRAIITEAFVSLPAPDNSPVSEEFPMTKTTALWDTGATNCVITKAFAEHLGLSPITQAPVNHAGGETLENVYLLDITLMNGLRFPGKTVTECKDATGNFGIIIGMDIICTGDLSITNHGGKTVVSFRHPSKKSIDFNVEMKMDNDKFFRSQRKPSKVRR
jgi:hypothetical protein